MKEEPSIPKMMPKGEVLRKAALRYPDLQTSAMEVLLNIKRVAEEFDCSSRDDLEPYGLSEGKFYVLADLFSEDLLGNAAPSPSEIADHLGVTRATITGLLDGLERDGFLTRQHLSQDRRSLAIHMTDKTRHFLDQFIPAQSKRFNSFICVLSEEERQTLLELLSKIRQSVSGAAVV